MIVESVPSRPPKPKRAGAEAASAAATADDELPPPVDLDRADRDLDLHGMVVDAEGRAIAGATLATVTYPWRVGNLLNHADYDVESVGAATRSARDGTFLLRLTRGAGVALRVTAAGFAPVELAHVLAGERLRVTMRPGVRLVVELTYADGAPVAGATVAVAVHERQYDEASTASRARAVTGADGVCTLDGLLPGGRGFVEPSVPGAHGGWTQVELPTTGEKRVEIRLRAARTLVGRVVDAETKAPIAGARVGMNWTLENAVATGADGTYELAGWTGDGASDVHARADGYAHQGRIVGDAARVDFELARGYAVVGRVVGADRATVAGAQVGLVATETDASREQQMSDGYAVTDAAGRFRVPGLRVGMRHVIVVRSPGHGRIRHETPVATSTEEQDVGEIVLPDARRVEGVVAGGDGKPLARATVYLSGPLRDDDLASFYGRAVDASTDDLGRFRFVDVAPGTYEVVVRPAGAQEIRERVHVPRDRDVLDVRIGRPAVREVAFTVVDEDGKALAGAWVSLSDSDNKSIQAQTDRDGRARVQVPAGRAVRFSVHPVGLGPRAFLQPPWRELGDDETDVKVVLEVGASVAGRVLDPEGAPVAGAWLELHGADARTSYATTDADGRFAALVPRGEKSTLVFEGRVQSAADVTDCGLAARVEGVEPGASVVVRCTRVPLDRRLTVVVLSPTGEPVAGAGVAWHCANGTGTRGMYPTADAAGRVTFERLPAREVSVNVSIRSMEFLEPASVDVVPEGQELRLVCRTASRITGVVVGKDGTPIGYGSVRAKRRGEGVAWGDVRADGTFVLLLPEGETAPVRVEVDRDNDDKPEASLDAVAPGTQGLRLVVEKP